MVKSGTQHRTYLLIVRLPDLPNDVMMALSPNPYGNLPGASPPECVNHVVTYPVQVPLSAYPML